MSFQDKIASMMARPNSDAPPRDDVPWWMRYSARGLGTVGGFLAILLGLFNIVGIITLNVTGVVMGIWQMLAGFLVLVCEAPCCCFFIDFVQSLSDKLDARPYWNKAALYGGLAIFPIIFAFSLTTFFGSGLIFGTGVIYGMMALGKKASPEEMRSAAAMEAGRAGPGAGATTRSNLVANAQPISFTSPPK